MTHSKHSQVTICSSIHLKVFIFHASSNFPVFHKQVIIHAIPAFHEIHHSASQSSFFQTRTQSIYSPSMKAPLFPSSFQQPFYAPSFLFQPKHTHSRVKEQTDWIFSTEPEDGILVVLIFVPLAGLADAPGDVLRTSNSIYQAPPLGRTLLCARHVSVPFIFTTNL